MIGQIISKFNGFVFDRPPGLSDAMWGELKESLTLTENGMLFKVINEDDIAELKSSKPIIKKEENNPIIKESKIKESKNKPILENESFIE